MYKSLFSIQAWSFALCKIRFKIPLIIFFQKIIFFHLIKKAITLFILLYVIGFVVIYHKKYQTISNPLGISNLKPKVSLFFSFTRFFCSKKKKKKREMGISLKMDPLKYMTNITLFIQRLRLMEFFLPLLYIQLTIK